jgi:hypothetical protein
MLAIAAATKWARLARITARASGFFGLSLT